MTVRDSRRNEDYFREYIQTQKGRIARFEEVFQKFQPPEDAQKMEQCAVSLGNFYRDLFCAQYSAGEQKTVLQETYVRWLAYIRCLNAVPWSDAVDLLSLALLLGEAVDETLSFPWEDALVRRLAGKSGGEVKFGKAVPFLRCLDGADGPEELREYLRNSWYADCRDASWHGAAERQDSTYCGYWCFTGAAVVRLKGFDPALFRETDCFPLDLL